MNINILLADDHKLMREGLRALIEEEPNMTVIAEAEDGEAAVRQANDLSPDIIIMDISMPGLNGIEATRRIREARTASKVIALSMHLEWRIVLEMLNAGASGYLLKDCAFDEVIHAIRTVASNSAYLSPKIAELVLKDIIHRLPEGELPPLSELTARERAVMQFVSEGKDAKKIAPLLHVSVKTAESLCQRIILRHIVPRLRGSSNEVCGADAKGDRIVSLTSREKEILLWVKDGKSTWEIASILGISQDTVKFHLKNVFQKLNTTSRSQTIAIALETKLIGL
jgi:two-component system response regulator NreC